MTYLLNNEPDNFIILFCKHCNFVIYAGNTTLVLTFSQVVQTLDSLTYKSSLEDHPHMEISPGISCNSQIQTVEN